MLLQATREQARATDFMLQVASGGRAAREVRLTNKYMRHGFSSSLLEEETAIADRPHGLLDAWDPKSRGLVTNFNGTVHPQLTRRWQLDSSLALTDLTRSMHVAAETPGTHPCALFRPGVMLGRYLRTRLGEDPSAWGLALELLDAPGTPIQEAVQTAAATLDVPPTLPGRRMAWPWLARRASVIEFEDEPLYGPQNGWGRSGGRFLRFSIRW